jgi:hypothetical protein
MSGTNFDESKHPRKGNGVNPGQFGSKPPLPQGDPVDFTKPKADRFKAVAAQLQEEVEAQGFSIKQDGESIEVGIGYYKKDGYGRSVYLYVERRIAMRDEDSITEELGADTLVYETLSYKDSVLQPMECSRDEDGLGKDDNTNANILSDIRDFMEIVKGAIEDEVKDGDAFWKEAECEASIEADKEAEKEAWAIAEAELQARRDAKSESEKKAINEAFQKQLRDEKEAEDAELKSGYLAFCKSEGFESIHEYELATWEEDRAREAADYRE